MDQNLKTNPLISVTVCTYNRANMINKAIQSAINQTYPNIEIIIVDDASTDNTEEIVKSIQSPFPIKYFKNENNLGIAGTRNETIKNSSGKYIAILDSDDFWIDNSKIEKQVSFLESNPEYALVGTHAKVINSKDEEIGDITNETENSKIKDALLIQNQFVHSTVLYKREAIVENGLFDKNKSPFEDYDLMLKIARKSKVANLSIFSTVYRDHLDGESKKLNLKKKLVFFVIIIKNFPFYKGRIKSITRRLHL